MPLARRIKCLKTGRLFKNTLEASKYLGVTNAALINKLRGRRQNNTGMRYIEDCNEYAGGKTLAELELEFIKGAIEFYGGNKSKAARKIGIGIATLHRKLK